MNPNIAKEGEQTQFKEGESGNPAGKPKGIRNLSTILREMLEEEVEIQTPEGKQKKQFKDVIIRKLLKAANDGNIKAIDMILDRLEGKPKQSMDMTSGGQPFGNIMKVEIVPSPIKDESKSDISTGT